MLNSKTTLSEKDKQNPKKDSTSNKILRKVKSQAFFFMGDFLLTSIAGNINVFIQLMNSEIIYTILVLHYIFAPAQGFFDFLGYMLPKMIQRNHEHNKRNTTAGRNALS